MWIADTAEHGVNAFAYRCESAMSRVLDVLVGQLVELRGRICASASRHIRGSG